MDWWFFVGGTFLLGSMWGTLITWLMFRRQVRKVSGGKHASG